MQKKNLCVLGTQGAVRESNPRPLPPEGRIIPLDQRPWPASSEDRTRDLALTKRMLCQLSYRGDRRVGARVGKAAPGPRAKKDLQKRTCSTGFEPATPRFEVWCAIHCATSTCSRGGRGAETMLRRQNKRKRQKIFSRQLRDSNSRGQCPIDF